MKTPLFVLGFLSALSLHAQSAAPASTTPAPASASASAPAADSASTVPVAGSATAAPRAGRTPPNTHGLDMRTQSGPAETMSARGYSPPIPVDPKLPTLWLIGDSTVRNGSPGNGSTDGQWGWGAPLTFYFDATKVNVVNRALGGTSARSFYNDNWKSTLALIKKGDVLLLQFGTNDGGKVATTLTGDLSGVGDETQDVTARGATETIHTFGWYLKQFIAETRAKGATTIICSLIPRKSWDANDHIKRASDTFAGWAGQVAQSEKVGFIDLNELIARKYDVLGKEKVDQIYVPVPTAAKPLGEAVHTGWDGAVMNAEIVVSGLKALKDDPVAAYFSEKAKPIAPAPDLTKPATEPTKTDAVKPDPTNPMQPKLRTPLKQIQRNRPPTEASSVNQYQNNRRFHFLDHVLRFGGRAS